MVPWSTPLIYLFIYFFICSGFCHTFKWNSHGFTCVPPPDPPSHLPLHPLPLHSEEFLTMILWLHLWSAINAILSPLYFWWSDSWTQRLDKIQIQLFCFGGLWLDYLVGTTYWKCVMPIHVSGVAALQHNVFFVVQSLGHVLSLQPHGLQHTRLPCPSPSPGACSNSCPFSWWGHPTILSSVIPFSSCRQSFPASESFIMSWLFRPLSAKWYLCFLIHCLGLS